MSIAKNNETIFINGQIFTSNPAQPYANTMVVRDGRIAWVGDQKDLGERNGETIDLKGRRVLPGFIDAHLHPLYLGKLAKQITCTPPVVNSIADLQAEIRQIRKTQGVNAWIEGMGYDEGKFLEGRAPTRWDLDEAASDVPVIITRSCAHIAVVNSLALELAGITEDTPNPPGGQIDRDENGKLTGVLREDAKDLVLKIMPVPTLEEDAQTLAELSPQLLAHGITAITELMARTEPVDYFDMYLKAREIGLKQRTVLYYKWEDLEKNPVIDEDKLFRDESIHVGGIKVFADGSISGKTAWVNPPFLGADESYGIQMTSEKELLAAAAAAKAHHIQLVVHAMGEQAIDLIVNTFYDKDGWISDAPSVRIEHVTFPTEQTIKRAVKAGIGFVTQPIFQYAEIESYLNNLGADRTIRAYPVRTLLEAGAKLAFSSDAPGTAWSDPANPFIGLKSAVTRVAHDGTNTGQDERVDVQTAITLYTKAAQEITQIPDIGQLKPGYHADFIVLDQDIFEISPEKIDEIQVEETYMAGQLVYEKKTAENALS